MRTLRSLLAVLLAILMVCTMSFSTFAAYENLTYEDVSELFNTTLSSAALMQIKFADSLGIVSGLKNGNFLPEMKVTRGEALKIAYRMLHYNYDEISQYADMGSPFDEAEGGDVTDVSTLRPYLAWAMDYQLINSEYVPESQFKPNEYITGEEFIVLIKKVCGMVEENYQEAFDSDEGFYSYADFEDLVATFEDTAFSLAEISADSETVNREQAAVAVACAMMFDPEIGYVADDMYTYFEKDTGVALECMATEIYGCDYASLNIRATKEMPLEYENLTADVLLSNGVAVDTGVDMTDFIGFPIVALYFDKDGSETFTADEEMFGYEVQSPMVYEKSLSELTIVGNRYIEGSDSGDTFAMYSNVPRYLNGGIWPQEDLYRFNQMLTESNPATASYVYTRPNLQFKFVKSSSSTNADIVFVTEWIPGQVMTVNESYISLRSYYNDESYVFSDKNTVYHGTSTLSAGDIVNFYVSDETLHVSMGVTAELKAPVEGTDETTAQKCLKDGDATYLKHLYYDNASKPLSAFTGTVTAVLDVTGTSYVALEEARATKEEAVEIISSFANNDGKTATIEAKVLATGEIVEFSDVEIARISSSTGKMNDGDIFTYYENVDGKINMFGVDPVKKNAVIEADDYFWVDGGEKLLKAKGYEGGAKPINGSATLMIDHNGGVWSVA